MNPTYGELLLPIQDPLNQVNDIVKKTIFSTLPTQREIQNYFLQTKGKQLRASLVIFTAKKATKNIHQDTLLCAAALELIHNATLVHDDIIDEAKTRRGQATIVSKWGETSALLFGDYLVSKAFEICSELSNPEMIKVLSHATSQVCSGEILQNQYAFQNDLDKEKYLEIIDLKTASLFRAACLCGHLSTKPSKKQVTLFESLGTHLGIAYQIMDDCMDLSLGTEDSGKSSLRDLAGGKMTLPLILLSQSHPKEERDIFIQKLFQREAQTIKDVQSKLKESSLLESCQNKARKHLKAGVKLIEEASGLDFKNELIHFSQLLESYLI